MSEMRTDLDWKALPRRMRHLPVDERGYPVPWFVDWLDGKPEFRAMDSEKWMRAIKQKRCWVCGDVLGVRFAFVAGPMCGINRTSAEPPSHVDCAEWSARNCPFLSNPEMVRRQDELVNNQAIREAAPGMAILRNPGVAMVWVARQYELFPDGLKPGRYLIQMGEPERVEWWCRGRRATRAEVDASIDSGLPNLETVARQQRGALEALHKAVERFRRWLPAAEAEAAEIA